MNNGSNETEPTDMILLAESDNYDVFTDPEADLVHVDFYGQGITLHLTRIDFLEMVQVLETAVTRLKTIADESEPTQS
ncbi:MAG: hypothetical protein HY774_20775 [Acidobacteria bacterium]|nr:hypothetical protein [Acidobacteriota bacterium]